MEDGGFNYILCKFLFIKDTLNSIMFKRWHEGYIWDNFWCLKFFYKCWTIVFLNTLNSIQSCWFILFLLCFFLAISQQCNSVVNMPIHNAHPLPSAKYWRLSKCFKKNMISDIECNLDFIKPIGYYHFKPIISISISIYICNFFIFLL